MNAHEKHLEEEVYPAATEMRTVPRAHYFFGKTFRDDRVGDDDY